MAARDLLLSFIQRTLAIPLNRRRRRAVGRVRYHQLSIESLENRCLLTTVLPLAADVLTKPTLTVRSGVAYVAGTVQADTITIRQVNGNIFFDGTSGATVPTSSLQKIEIQGGDGNDTIINTTNISAIIFGGEGNDQLSGGLGNDTLSGGGGNDDLFGNDGIDTIHGDDGNDTIDGGNDTDWLYGDAGNDTLRGGLGGNGDNLYGGSGDDNLSGGGGNDDLSGDDGDDLVIGEAGDDKIYGGNGTDRLDGGEGKDYVNATGYDGAREDRLLWSPGNDDYQGLARSPQWSHDRLVYRAAAGDKIVLYAQAIIVNGQVKLIGSLTDVEGYNVEANGAKVSVERGRDVRLIGEHGLYQGTIVLDDKELEGTALAVTLTDLSFSGSASGQWWEHGPSTPDMLKMVDVNGDGRDDAVYFDTSRSRGIWVGINDGQSFRGTGTGQWWEHGPSSPDMLQFADVNGDGRKDAIYFDTSRSRGVWVGINDGKSFRGAGTGQWWAHGPSTPKMLQFADVTGDGRADAIYFDTNRSRGIWVGISDGKSFNGAGGGQWWEHGDSTPDMLQFADVNGDGRKDAIYFDTSRSRGVWVGINDGKSFRGAGTGQWWVHGPSTPNMLQMADVNGDGREDAIYFDTSRSRGVWVGLSDGKSFNGAGSGQWWEHGESTPDMLQMADVNGDGLKDAIYFDTLRSQGVWVGVNDGNSFRGVGTGQWWAHGWSTPNMLQMADVNGDGRKDAVYFDTSRSRGIWVGITNGVAHLQGTALADLITVRQVAQNLYFNGTSGASGISIAANAVRSIEIAGGAGNDSISNTTNITTTIRGGDHDDKLASLNASDNLYGDAGDDTLNGSKAFDTLAAKDGVLYVKGSAQDDVIDIYRNDGKVYVRYNGRAMTNSAGKEVAWAVNRVNVDGGDGNDTITNANFLGATAIHGGAGDDTLTGFNEHDALYGDAGNDTLNGSKSIDLLYVNDGVLYVKGSEQNDVIDLYGIDGKVYVRDDGQTMTESALVGTVRPTIWRKMTNSAGLEVAWAVNSVEVNGGDGNDTITNRSVRIPVIIHGGAGDDILAGLNYFDDVFGDSGNDTLDGVAGLDTFMSQNGALYIEGSSGNNHIRIEETNGRIKLTIDGMQFKRPALFPSDAIYVTGGGGNDIVEYVSQNLNAFRQSFWSPDVTEQLNTVKISLEGWGSLDTVILSQIVTYRDGELRVQGTTGDDNISVTLSGRSTSVVINGKVYVNSILPSSISKVVINGGDGNDTITGTGLTDYIYGGLGNDVIYGLDGDDWLFGENGSDRLYGGHGNDVLSAGLTGADVLDEYYDLAKGDDTYIVEGPGTFQAVHEFRLITRNGEVIWVREDNSGHDQLLYDNGKRDGMDDEGSWDKAVQALWETAQSLAAAQLFWYGLQWGGPVGILGANVIGTEIWGDAYRGYAINGSATMFSVAASIGTGGALSPVVGEIVAGVVASAAGSAAGQVVLIAGGQQSSFDWRALLPELNVESIVKSLIMQTVLNQLKQGLEEVLRDFKDGTVASIVEFGDDEGMNIFGSPPSGGSQPAVSTVAFGPNEGMLILGSTPGGGGAVMGVLIGGDTGYVQPVLLNSAPLYDVHALEACFETWQARLEQWKIVKDITFMKVINSYKNLEYVLPGLSKNPAWSIGWKAMEALQKLYEAQSGARDIGHDST